MHSLKVEMERSHGLMAANLCRLVAWRTQTIDAIIDSGICSSVGQVILNSLNVTFAEHNFRLRIQ